MVTRHRAAAPEEWDSGAHQAAAQEDTLTAPDTDRAFTGSIATLYEEHLVPLIFEPYAVDMAERVAARPVTRVLKIAAGTGVATRRMAAVLPEGVLIVATDLNQAMLDRAAVIGTVRPVEWRQADMLDLPFEDGGFDAVVCQFGLMFPADRAAAFASLHRVLRPGGFLFFSVWDRIEDNEFADVVTAAMVPLFPEDPPRFLARTPHGYHDLDVVIRDLRAGGFEAAPEVDTVAARSRAGSARVVAVAFCHGTPLRTEIEARLEEATDLAEEALIRAFGAGAVDGGIQAHVLVVER